MKKILSLVLVLCAVFSLASCNKETEKEYTLGMGVVVTEDKQNASTEQTVASIVIDKETEKIVACRIDTIAVDSYAKDGSVNTAEVKTKMEQGDSYNMVAYGGAKAEWHVQAKAFETYVVGKTKNEVSGIQTGDAELVASCTIDVTDFTAAVVKAFDDAHSVSFKTASDNITLGVALEETVTESAGKVNSVVDVSAVAMVDGKVSAALLDCTDVTFTPTEGDYTYEFKGSKREQGEDYNMVEYGGAISEWYVQAQAFANTAIGKSASEIASLAIENVAGCTITVDEMKVALEKAASYAR